MTAMTAWSQSLAARESFAAGGVAQPRAASTRTCVPAVAVQVSAVTVTWRSTGSAPLGSIETESPVAVAGVAFAIVHDAVVPGASLTRAVKAMPTPVAAGASIFAVGVVQSTWNFASARAVVQLDAVAPPPCDTARVRPESAAAVVACRTTLLSPYSDGV